MRAVVAALTALVALGLAGCGGGGRSSHGAFVQDAARICRTANGRFAEVEIPRPSAEGAAVALESIIEIGTVALADLRDLKPPTDEQVDVNAWLGTLEQALDEVSYTRDLLEEGRASHAIDAAVRADLLTRRAHTLAKRVGLARACRVPRILPER